MPMPRLLWFLTLFYAVFIVLASWFSPWFVRLFSIDVNAGDILFPLSYLLSNVITEVYGYKSTRRVIWYGLIFYLAFMTYEQIVIHMPNPDYPTHNAVIDALLVFKPLVFVVTVVGYLISQPLNAYCIAKLKVKWCGHYLWLRFFITSAVAISINTLIVAQVTAYDNAEFTALKMPIISLWYFNIAYVLFGVFLAMLLATWLKRYERLDIYDTRTRFNFFKLEANYTDGDNHFNARQA